MITIVFQEPQGEGWAAWREKCQQEQRLLNEAVLSGKTGAIKKDLYKGKVDGIKEDIYLSREGPFRGKCAFCEVDLLTNQHGDMEHFRPKGGVTDRNDKVVLIVQGGKKVPHPGYYWLTYDWRNLLPSCQLCNQPKRKGDRLLGKGTRFPVRAFRAKAPGQEAKEAPLLINPVADSPEEHLRVDDLGVFHALDARGDACIKILGLNDRDLPNARRSVYQEVRQELALCLQLAAIGEGNPAERLARLQHRKNGTGAHTSAVRKAIEDGLANVNATAASLQTGSPMKPRTRRR